MSGYYELAQHIRDMYKVGEVDYFGASNNTQQMYDKINERVDEIACTIEKWGNMSNQDDHNYVFSDEIFTSEISGLLGELLGRYILMCDSDEDTSVYADAVNVAIKNMKALDDIADKVFDWLVDEGRRDKQFKYGEIIRYSPSEVQRIIRKHITEVRDNWINNEQYGS